MEHPLRVDEFIPSSEAHVVHDEPIAVPVRAAAPLPPLPSLSSSEALLLRPNDPDYAKYLPATNKRRQLSPALRAVCKTEHAVAVMVDWVRTNNLKFAVPDAVDLSQVKRALIVKLRHHGDVLLASPVLGVLKAHAPKIEIDALVYDDTAPMLEALWPSRLRVILDNWQRGRRKVSRRAAHRGGGRSERNVATDQRKANSQARNEESRQTRCGKSFAKSAQDHKILGAFLDRQPGRAPGVDSAFEAVNP